MAQKKIVSIMGVGVLMAFLAGCAGNGASAGSEAVSMEGPQEMIQKLELENTTHVDMQLAEKVCVDAEVTPYEDYKNGLNVYEVIWPTEGGEGYTTADFEENPMLYHKDLSMQIESLQELTGRKFSLSGMSVSKGSRDLYMEVPADHPNVVLGVGWDLDEDYRMHMCTVQYGDLDGFEIDMIGFMEAYLGNFQECLAKDADPEIQQAAAYGKEFLENFVGQELADEYYCIPMEDMGENTYVFLYPPQIDGFPVAHVDTGTYLPADFDMSALTEQFKQRNEDRSITDLYMKAPMLGYEDGKITAIYMRQIYEMGDVYQKNAECIDLKEVLTCVAKYFDSILVAEDITITNINLGYSSKCIVKDDGTLHDTARPYWYVRYYNEEEGSRCLFIDALTGEIRGRGLYNYLRFN